MKENKIRVVEVKVGEYARIVEIDNSLETLQKAVGGSPAMFSLFDNEVAIICNEKTETVEATANRFIALGNTIQQIIYGDFLIVYAPNDSDEFASIPMRLAEKYRNMFLFPQVFYNGIPHLVTGKTPLTEAEKRDVFVTMNKNNEDSFGKMLQVAEILYEKIPHLYYRWELNRIAYSKMSCVLIDEPECLKAAHVIQSLGDNPKDKLFYYDENVFHGYACPIRDKSDLLKVLTDNICEEIFYRNYKKVFPLYRYCVEEAEFRLNNLGLKDLPKGTVDSLADFLFERNETLIDSTVIDKYTEEFIKNQNLITSD